MFSDILFIHPANQKKTYQSLSESHTAICPPVWTLLLAGGIQKKGHSVAIYDTNVEGWSVEKALSYKPKLIVIMVYGHNPIASTQTMPAAIEIIDDLRGNTCNVPIAIGGNHPSALPERTMKEVHVDYVIQGEGLYTINDLILFIKDQMLLEDARGLWYRNNSSFSFTTQAPLIADLDKELGSYPWDLIPSLDHYRAHEHHCFQYAKGSKEPYFNDVRQPYAALYTSLGCPLNCGFCMINDIFGGPNIRYWSIDTVIGWIDDLVLNHKVRNIRFDDELFICDPKRVENLCDALIEKKYDLNIHVHAFPKIRSIEKILPKMAKAGIQWVSLGIETGNTEQLKIDGDKKIVEDIKETVEAFQRHRINVHASYMIGFENDDFDAVSRTVKLAKDYNTDYFQFKVVMPLPGSPLYKTANKEQFPNDWNAYSQHSYETTPQPTKYLSAKEVLRLRDQAYTDFYEDDQYIDYIKGKYGPQVSHHLKNLGRIRLPRKLLDEA